MYAPITMLTGCAAREDRTSRKTFAELVPAPGHVLSTSRTATLIAMFVAECRMSTTKHHMEVRMTVDGAVADPGPAVLTSDSQYETSTHLAFKGSVPPGTHTVTVEWKVTGGTGYVRNRSLTVWEVR